MDKRKTFVYSASNNQLYGMTGLYEYSGIPSTNIGFASASTEPVGTYFQPQHCTLWPNGYRVDEHGHRHYISSPLPVSYEPVNYMGQIGTYGTRVAENIPAARERAPFNPNIGSNIVVGYNLPENALIHRGPAIVQTDKCINPQQFLPEKPKNKVKRPPKFACLHAGCKGQTFTTKYRYQTHVNRFHTPEAEQKKYHCDNCGLYTTVYSTDLTRHTQSCAKP